MLPAVTASSEQQAYALEAVAIQLEAPPANVMEGKQKIPGRGVKQPFHAAVRCRPSSWRRTQRRPWSSLWANPANVACLERRLLPRPVAFPELQGAKLSPGDGPVGNRSA